MLSPDCPATSAESRCCRFDGTCGTDLSTHGLGCVPSRSEGGTGTNCQLTGTCRFVFRVTTVAGSGTYAPQNVGAIWIEDGSGKFVRTLIAWGKHFLSSATRWTSDGSNSVDAVTAATRHYEGPLIATWNCLDTTHTPVPNGPYQICMTFVEEPSIPIFDSGTIPYLCVPFDLSDAPLDFTPAPDLYFRDMHVTKD
jgi:hypothetical protein